jgi:hypothetical protein
MASDYLAVTWYGAPKTVIDTARPLLEAADQGAETASKKLI